jgi:2,3-bisphosphoglycerate-independent phosphoglycerate mutase
MDRDKRWERVKKGYDLMVSGIGQPFRDAASAIQSAYDQDITDEFIAPSVMVDDHGKPLATLDTNDVVICFNFRTDRLREITTALTQQDLPEHGMHTLDLYYLTMAVYDDSYQGIKVIFDKEMVANTLGEVVSKQGLTQVRIAETEKYPHVTFFFSGGQEEPFMGEERIMIPSPRDVATYDQKPAMSAPGIAEAIVPVLKEGKHGFVVLNFANGDMVGHTGVYEAIREAVETVDHCASRVTEAALEGDYMVMITADHGNADFVLNPDGTPNTAHSLNDVPLYLINARVQHLKPGRLADLAPTILSLMDLPVPEEMTGENLTA